MNKIAFAAATVVAAGGLMACAAMAQAPAAPAMPAAAAPTASAAAPAAAPAGDAATAALVDETCTQCHDIAMVTNGNRSAADWADTVQTMRDRGAKLTDDQAKVVVDYLARTYPAK